MSKNGHFWQKSSFFEGFWLITSIFVICFGWKLPKVFSYVSYSMWEKWYLLENSKFGIFLAKNCKKRANFARNPVFEVFLLITSIFDLDLAENFLKSSPKCLLACVSSGTRGKIQNWGFFWPKSVKKWPFLPKIQFFEGFWLITSIFVISFGWKLPKVFSYVSYSVWE